MVKVERGVYTWLNIRSASERELPEPPPRELSHQVGLGLGPTLPHLSLIPRTSPLFFTSYLLRIYIRMLEAFEILTTSGVVLWSKSYAPVGAHVINSLINDVFIEEKVVPQSASVNGALPVYKKEKYTLKWKRVKEFNLIFVVRFGCNVACQMRPDLPRPYSSRKTDFNSYRPSTNPCCTSDGLTSSLKISRPSLSMSTKTS